MAERKKFDCMAMKRRLQRRFYRQTRDMSPADLIAHIRQRVESGPFSEFWHETRDTRQAPRLRGHLAKRTDDDGLSGRRIVQHH
jgi:protein-disulfide isomerase-like protein with CxxC motif